MYAKKKIQRRHEALFTFWSRLSPIRMRQRELTGGKDRKVAGRGKKVYSLLADNQTPNCSLSGLSSTHPDLVCNHYAHPNIQ